MFDIIECHININFLENINTGCNIWQCFSECILYFLWLSNFTFDI